MGIIEYTPITLEKIKEILKATAAEPKTSFTIRTGELGLLDFDIAMDIGGIEYMNKDTLIGKYKALKDAYIDRRKELYSTKAKIQEYERIPGIKTINKICIGYRNIKFKLQGWLREKVYVR